MATSVSRLRPNRGSFSKALAAYRAAQLQVCLSELHATESIQAVTLRARALLRQGLPERALAAFRSVEPGGDRDRSEVSLLRAVATARTGDDVASNEALREAFVYSISSVDTALESEVEFYRGLLAFGTGDLKKAGEACARAMDVARTPLSFSKAAGYVPLPHVVSRIEELLGLIAAGEGDYRTWQRYAKTALETLDACPIKDVFQEAFALKNLTLLAREFDSMADAKYLTDRISALAYTDDLARPRFATFESLGWCSALRGDVPGALRHFRRAADAAVIVPEHVNVAVDRALVARELGHRGMATEEVGHALDLAAGYDWQQAPGDYCLVLLPLAQAAAAHDPARARKALDTYARVRNAMDATYVGRLELRVRAEEAYADGIVLRAEGRHYVSSERFQSAFATWTQIGFEWRAARAALELAEIESSDVFRLAVRRDLVDRPHSIFAERARLVA